MIHSARGTDFIFPALFAGLVHFPRLTSVTCIPGISDISVTCFYRAWHWLPVFPRLALVTSSPALATGQPFSRA